MVNYPTMLALKHAHSPTTTVEIPRAYEDQASPTSRTVKRFEFDRADPLKSYPGAAPTPHPASPIAHSPIFSDPKVAQTLLVDYLAGYTASRLCSSYNITLPQLFAWRRSPETQALLAEHEAFSAEQTRHVQHDKEPEIILTLCAIATRGTSESESRRAASDLLRAFKFRDYLLHRGPRTARNPAQQSDAQPPDPSDHSEPSAKKQPSNAPPRPPSYTPSNPILRNGRANEHSANLPKSAAPSSPSRTETTPSLDSPDSLCETANAFQPVNADRFEPSVERIPERHPQSAVAESPHAESVQPIPSNLAPAEPQAEPQSEPQAERATEADAIQNELESELESELEDDQLETDDSENDETDDDIDDDIDDDLDDETNEHDDDIDDEEDESDDENVDDREDHHSPQSAIPNPKSEMRSRSALRPQSSALPLTSDFEHEILALPATVPAPAHARPAPDPAPGFPLCLTKKPSTPLPTFEEMAAFMPPPSKSFNPFWPESDILYLCYPGRTDKHNLRNAIVSHQEMLTRSGAQALVERNHFTPEQQSHEAYCAAEDFYKQLARKTPPPDH